MRTLRTLTAASALAAVLSIGVTTSTAWGQVGAPHHTAALQTQVTKYKIVTYTFNAAYSGTVSILWSDSGLTKASITGKGSKVDNGFTALTGSGTTTAAGQSDPVSGTGTMGGTGEILHLKFSGTATATSSSAPTTVVLSGTATVTSGAGKFAGATGSFKIAGSFNIQSTSGSEKDSYSATLKGSVKVKVAVK